ncbi:hypothetical protein DXG01_012985 [Tephrocybe rancida]|nr:hypothetical protein DXG01_012985 [Tephrocybe rancida]
MALGSASRSLHQIVQNHVKERIHAAIAIHELNPPEFLALMHESSTIITGSTALLVLNARQFIPRDLDLSVSCQGNDLEILLDGLRRDFKMVRVPTNKGSGNDGPYATLGEVHEIITMEHDEHKIHIMVSVKGALRPLFSFHLTVVMNCITSSSVFCAYPNLTLNFRNLVNESEIVGPSGLTVRGKECLIKYAKRGYEFGYRLHSWPEFSSHTCGSDHNCPFTFRSVNDKGVLWFDYQGRTIRKGQGHIWLLSF